jgi:Rrf2 family protein
MISLSLTTSYAIKALTCLASGDCVTRHISDIARCACVPRAYLAKIFSALAYEGLVQTKRGYNGGISLARPAEDISLLQIVEAVEGKAWVADCLLGLDGCEALTICPTREFWARIRRDITEELRQTSLAALMAARRRGGLPTKQVPHRKALSACRLHGPSRRKKPNPESKL